MTDWCFRPVSTSGLADFFSLAANAPVKATSPHMVLSDPNRFAISRPIFFQPVHRSFGSADRSCEPLAQRGGPGFRPRPKRQSDRENRQAGSSSKKPPRPTRSLSWSQASPRLLIMPSHVSLWRSMQDFASPGSRVPSEIFSSSSPPPNEGRRGRAAGTKIPVLG